MVQHPLPFPSFCVVNICRVMPATNSHKLTWSDRDNVNRFCWKWISPITRKRPISQIHTFRIASTIHDERRAISRTHFVGTASNSSSCRTVIRGRYVSSNNHRDQKLGLRYDLRMFILHTGFDHKPATFSKHNMQLEPIKFQAHRFYRRHQIHANKCQCKHQMNGWYRCGPLVKTKKVFRCTP